MSEIIQQQDSRRIFIDTLCELAEKDKRIVFIVPDVGFNYAEKFQKMFPERYFNTGVTEQSTVILAAAMALAGLKPYVYSMIPFVLFRPYEMVRNAVVHHGADVKLLGVLGSSKYKMLGFSHNLNTAAEDFHACNNLKLNWAYPDVENVRRVVMDTYKSNKPYYIRL